MTTPFDLWHEDGLLFEDHPEWFVHLDRTPIVWTVRGLRLFAPRFSLIGVAIKTICTASHFEAAWSRWLAVERQLLVGKITAAARDPANLQAQCLRAILQHDVQQAEILLSALESRAWPIDER